MFRLILIGIICFQSVYALELRIGSSAESYEQYSIRILKAKSPSRLLNQKFIEAVKLYQSKESHKSFRLFQEIVAEAYLYEWPSIQRQSIAYSFLRLAEQYGEKKDFYINEARKFYEASSLSASSFSAETMLELKKKNSSFLDFPVLHFFESPHYLSINSKKIDLKNWVNLKLPEGPIRLVILSKTQERFIYIGDTQSLLSEKISVKNLDYGNCQNPKLFDSNLKDSFFEIHYKEECSYKYNAGVFLKQDIYKKPSFINTQKEDSKLPKISIQSPKKKWKHWDKVAWGIGILATGLIYQHNNRTKKVVYSE